MNKDLENGIRDAGRMREPLERICVQSYQEVMHKKEQLPLSLPDIDSLRDFGGCYLVHGRYLFQVARLRKIAFASMIDVSITGEYQREIDSLKKDAPGIEFETICGDFRDPSLFTNMRETDAALLYEVILHQENYIEVIKNVCKKTRKFICLAQPCLLEDFFVLPGGAVMLQFFDEELKDLLRTKSFWPKEPQVDRFSAAYWMWGQTTSQLIGIMRGFGWALYEGYVIDNVCGSCWEYPMLVFSKT
jgi:hypothetical protein